MKTISYRVDWLTNNLGVGQAPMSYDALDSLRDLGVGAILNLCAEFCDLHWIEAKAGFEVYYLPIPDEEAPQVDDLEKALDWLDECLYLGKKVLVHCRFGIGRTGTVVNAYLLRKGLGHKLAGKKLKGLRSQPANFDQWWFIRKYGKKEKRLTIREPSLETNNLVDLFPFFRDYEKLSTDLDRRLEQAGKVSLCGRDHNECCCRPLPLTFIETVCVNYFLNSTLSRKVRQEAIDRAIRLRTVNPDDSENVMLQYSEQGYLCPLNDSGKCVIFAYRPVSCRIFDLSVDELHEIEEDLTNDLEKISASIYFAFTSRFSGKSKFSFPMSEVVSGRFVQIFFHHLLQDNRQSVSRQNRTGLR